MGGVDWYEVLQDVMLLQWRTHVYIVGDDGFPGLRVLVFLLKWGLYAAVDVWDLYEDALDGDLRESFTPTKYRRQFSYRAKAIEMSLQNKKLAKRVEKEGEKVLKVLRQMEAEWQRTFDFLDRYEEFEEEKEKDKCAAIYVNEENHARCFLSLLILCLEASLPSAKGSSQQAKSNSASKRLLPQRVILEWFEKRKNPKPPDVKSGSGADTRQGKQERFPSLSDLSVFSLSLFLDEHLQIIRCFPYQLKRLTSHSGGKEEK
uniref:Uncharacterized protein n=1 Tax=Chromera velia CCMP2878 TaxID=1169474 RepID=A0A0G4IFG7_9ALVE|eukprot:Cvel_2451.t1-p1 / transcript=Cvel_2451.t1 / gene=Cvel_2451 / organism=Chromera_velia_CCMP2878 / gene_product=hypothetical protein / transcript_product=hypothetical protein / location=Cvel_scaffold96:44241-49116(+) / protein_length=259 / sequence_SO=supercontig / SO=protein_coding / is_pseudo=false